MTAHPQPPAHPTAVSLACRQPGDGWVEPGNIPLSRSTWFNPPFNVNVATTVAKTFLSLIDKHFPKDKNLFKIFNRNTIKVSYSCLPNLNQTISNNNHRLLQLHRMKESTQDSKLCNYRQMSSCPLDGKCLTKCVLYKATVTETTSNNQETYIGLTENEFKTRFNLHKSSFKIEHKRTSTTLSDHVWKLKKKNINFNIKWQVVKRVKPFAPQTKERADTSRGQKRQNPCPSSLRASDMFARVQQWISVHDNKLRSGTLLEFFGLY